MVAGTLAGIGLVLPEDGGWLYPVLKVLQTDLTAVLKGTQSQLTVISSCKIFTLRFSCTLLNHRLKRVVSY